jgi:hypothetical protein
MNKREIFNQAIERRKARLEELALQPLGKRFLHHTVLGIPSSLRSSIAYNIVKYGLLNSKDRHANPETAFRSSNTWFDDDYNPVFTLDDSYNGFRVGSDGIQLMDVLIDPKILKERRHYKTTFKSMGLLDAFEGEITFPDSIPSEYLLGAIVSKTGHNVLAELLTRPKIDPRELEREDKKVYSLQDEERVKIPAFYGGLVWGMNDFPDNNFPIFTGFDINHVPYDSGVRSGEEKATLKSEIPFEFYLASQIFPLTPEAYFGQMMRDIAERRGVSPRDYGLGIRCGKGLVTPEQILGRNLSESERRAYLAVLGKN